MAALMGGFAVLAGAFGAHALNLTGAAEHTFQTAFRYHLGHALAIGLVVALGDRVRPLAGWLFAAGIVLFSGSLYVLALDGPRWFGPITPVGGILFVAGWLCLGLKGRRRE